MYYKIVGVPVTDLSSVFINFSCYIQRDESKWLMDSGCSKHVMSHKANFIKYMPITRPGKAEIANKKELDILGVGTITLRHTMMDRTLSNITLVQVLYCMFQPQTGDFTLPALLQRRDVKHIGLGTAMMFILQMVQNLLLELTEWPPGCFLLRHKSYGKKIPRQ